MTDAAAAATADEMEAARLGARLQQLIEQVSLAATQAACADTACSLASGAHALLRDVFVWEASLAEEVHAPTLQSAISGAASHLEPVLRLDLAAEDELAPGRLAAPTAAAVAAELPQPGECAACLAAAVELAQVLGRNAATASMQRSLMPAVMAALEALMRRGMWRAHADAVVADERRALDIVRLTVAQLRTLAVGLQLPPGRQPVGCTWPAAAGAASLLGSAPLVAALQRWFAAAGGASISAAVVAAAQLVQHMPLQEFPGETREPRSIFFLASLPAAASSAVLRFDADALLEALNALGNCVCCCPRLNGGPLPRICKHQADASCVHRALGGRHNILRTAAA
ncbi:hypothetical protein C2E21_5198 [Chlorella sorokiniana]|uniref:Uncharacterized protein n=1 Tax=Chlorella sorokiniana TaxID=3076 RepID=A0A2P6TQ45_CHLSO|nr:hypothetical protein C2E21_5198 [Chlorella sorokiniana]|eukprot:PRW56155.1 hypothetical protein C2E21_5198 [Chlorella sorokiniana]